MSLDFINNYIAQQNKDNKIINWDDITKYQKIDMQFILQHKKNMNWYNISLYQSLTKENIIELLDYLHWDCLLKNNNIKEKYWYLDSIIIQTYAPHYNHFFKSLHSLRKIQYWATDILYRPNGLMFRQLSNQFEENKMLL